jgi:hypothetical protein
MSAKKSKPTFRGDRAMLEMQCQLALDPDLIPEPPCEGVAVIRPLLIRLCSVSALAVFVAWGLVSYSGLKKTAEQAPVSTPAIAGNQANVVDVQSLRLRPTIVQAATSTRDDKSQPVRIATADAEAAAPAPQSVTALPSADTAAMPPTPPQRASERRPVRLDSEEIDVLIKRGKDLLGDGDVAAARLLLRRAAEAGSAEAAFTLGTTFDPVSLQRLGAIGAIADLAQARQWYQRAAELGSSAASQQLAGLGDAR